MVIKSINDPAFRKYGKVVKGIDFSNIIEKLKSAPCPDGGTVYVPGDPELEACPEAKAVSESIYGGMPVQIGYCNGDNGRLDAVEYHRDSEINIAVTDCVMVWGSECDVEDDYTYDTAKMEAFLIPAGTAVECYATTLHYAPWNANGKKFIVGVVLPKGTNTDIEKMDTENPEDKILFARNKWLIAHPEAGIEGAFNGLVGENLHA